MEDESEEMNREGKREAVPRAEDGGDQPLLDAKGAAQLCMISESMFYKLSRTGKTPAPVRVGTLLRWRRKELLDWIVKGCPDDDAGDKKDSDASKKQNRKGK